MAELTVIKLREVTPTVSLPTIVPVVQVQNLPTTIKLEATGPVGPKGDKGDKGDSIKGDRGPQGVPGPATPIPQIIDAGSF